MKVNLKNNNVFLVIAVILGGLLVVGGTYAAFSTLADVNNGNYSGYVECFDIIYNDINDGTDTADITGTLFPSSNYVGGLSGNVSVSISDSCNVTGTGTLYIHVNNESSSKYAEGIFAHCEDPDTLETMTEYNEDESGCTGAGGIWVNKYPALKYAVYSSNNTLINSGYLGHIDNYGDVDGDGIINTSDKTVIEEMIQGNYSNVDSSFAADINFDGVIDSKDVQEIDKYVLGNDSLFDDYIDATGLNIPIYMNFPVTSSEQKFTIYLWLDGNITDNNFASLPFSGYMTTKVVQDN